ncbi:MAG: signal peptide peptidase SppA [Thermodesulfobacteriota bacterium]
MISFVAGRWGLFEGSGISLSNNKIAVISIQGVLTSSTETIREFKKYEEDKDVKALVLRIDSPGGTVVAAQEIYEEIQKLRENKVVLASMGNVAASGGYYVASATEEIVANPGTLTGSIGVISEYPNIEQLMKKVGLRSEVMKSGQFKDLGNPTREMTEAERQILQDLIDNIHMQFIRDVALGRGRTVEEIEPLADGRVFTGEQAKENGLVDRLGNFQDALDRAAELAGIEGKPVIIYPEEKRKKIWEYLIQSIAEGMGSVLRSTFEQMAPMSFHPEVLSVSGRR